MGTRRWRFWPLVLLGLAVVGGAVAEVGRGAQGALARSASPEPLVVPAQARVLVVAPHPDDEVLAAGALIQRVLSAGGRVRVVYVTEGDAYALAARRSLGKVALTPGDFRLLGELRRAESRRALGFLGAVEAVHLGFPDKGLMALWKERWDRPYWSRATAAAAVPYRQAFRPGTPYTGEELLRLLRENMRDFQPRLVVAPGIMDLHPDHQATALFVRAAWNEERRAGTLPGALVMEYRVHQKGRYVEPGLREDSLLRKEALFLNHYGRWLRLDPTAEERRRKTQAILAYSSQVRVMGEFLLPFAARPELFRVDPGAVGSGL